MDNFANLSSVPNPLKDKASQKLSSITANHNHSSSRNLIGQMSSSNHNRVFYLYIITLLVHSNITHALTQINIGLLLHDQSLWSVANDSFSNKDSVEIMYRTMYKPVMSNPINAALDLCEQLVTKQVAVLIITHPPGSPEVLPVSIAYTCSFYKLPIISIHTRDTIFSEKNIHPMFMRLVTPVDAEPAVWVDLMIKHGWRKAIILVADDHNGNSVYEAAVNQATQKNVQLIGDKFGFYDPNQPNADEILKRILDEKINIVLFYGSASSSSLFFSQVSGSKYAAEELVWIVSSSSLEAVQENGITGSLVARQAQGDDYRLLLHDAIRVVTNAVPRAIKNNGQRWTEPLKECKDTVDGWKMGTPLKNEIVATKLNEMQAKTGSVTFNSNGDRIDTEFDILNINSEQQIVTVGTWKPNKSQNALDIPDNSIEWPGGKNETPNGIILNTTLKVVTMDVEPFVFLNPVDPLTGECRERVSKVNIATQGVEVPCIKYNYSNNSIGDPQMLCCSGYCIDLLDKLSNALNFTYELHISKDGTFGNAKSESPNPNSFDMGGVNSKLDSDFSTKKWTGIVGELLSGEADLAVAHLTIDNERAQVIDFSNPFKHQGLSIMVKKKDTTSNLASFVQPFEYLLWLLIFLSVHVVAFIIYLLDKFSPFGNINVTKDSTMDDSMTLPSALWFAWGVLLNSGIGEGTPNSFSARVLGMVWAGFAMVVVASYTANLAAFLVLDRPESEISGINDARMRNPSEKYKFGTVIGGATEAYFKRKVEMSNMYRHMIQNSYMNSADAIQAIRNGSLQAFIWDSAVLDYEISKDCSLMTVGELFHRSGFGVGMPKNSPWREDISKAVLAFHEDGSLEGLDSDWVNYRSCGTQDSMPATLGLNNMAGVFILVAFGIVLGIPVVFLEIAYKKQQEKREKQIKLAKKLANQWRHKTQEALSTKRASSAETFEAPKTLPVGGRVLGPAAYVTTAGLNGLGDGQQTTPLLAAKQTVNPAYFHGLGDSSLIPGEIIPLNKSASASNHLGNSTLPPPPDRTKQPIIHPIAHLQSSIPPPPHQLSSGGGGICSLPGDSIYGTSNRPPRGATPPAPPKRTHPAGGVGAPAGGMNIPLSASAFIHQQQHHPNQPMTLQASSFDSESSSTSVQPPTRATGPGGGAYSRANMYSPDFSPNENKQFTSV
ncbi:glutamate receptor ionotropic, NMDA 1-like isoform X2 [Convolutriloba macropyga]|uniref:glutamate receptor ionotropic, NMDA 1-like isoform X2 n=1 Tax=Convolutriloba macropyga TaxID=536237 RepID=UPI003F528F08